MSDLSSQLRQVAGDAAAQARPLAVAEVIRRGNRRRQRVIAQRSLSGLSAVGIGAAFVLTGATSHPTAPESAAASRELTATEQTTSALGKITIVVKYTDESRARLKLNSIAYSIHSNAAVKHPQVVLTFRQVDAGGKGIAAVFLGVIGHSGDQHNFDGKLPAKVLNIVHLKGKGLTSGLNVSVGLMKQGKHPSISIGARSIIQEGVILH